MEYNFNTEHAQLYGVDESIIIKNFQFWITKNKANKKHLYDERTWTYNSINAFKILFPFWKENQIRRILKSLIDQKVIITGNYNKIAYDRTLWYAFLDENMFILESSTICEKAQMDIEKSTNGFEEKHRPIPDTNTYNTLLRNVITAPSGLEDTDTINSALDSKNNTSIENQPKEKKYYENKFLTYYNNQPYVQKHKNIKSKVYVMISRYIKRLQNGSFGKHLRSSHNDVLDIQWLKQNKLLSWLDHKFTDAEIYKMLDGVNAYFCEDFAPSASKRGLDVMLFNPQTGKSLALWLFLSPPTKKSAMVRTKYPETTKMYRKKAFTGRTFTEKEEREFIIGINRLGDFVEKRKAVFKTYKYRPFYMDGIYQRHAEWIRDTVNISVSPAHVLSSRNGFWTNFKNHLFKETGFNIDVGEEELQQSLKKSDAIIAEKKNKLYLKERWKDRAAAEECGIDVSRTSLDPRLDHWGEEVITAFFEKDFTAEELTEFLTKEKN